MPAINTAMSSAMKFAMGLYGDKALSPGTIFHQPSRDDPISVSSSRKAIIAIAPFMVLSFGGASLFRKSGPIPWLLGHICKTFMATITVPDNHPLLDAVKKWMSAQGMKANARELTLKQDNKPGNRYYNRDLFDKTNGRESKESERDLLELQPDGGVYYYRFNGRLLRFHVHQKMEAETMVDGKVVRSRSVFEGLQVSVSCFSVWAGPGLVLEFLKHIESLHLASQEFRTKIHQASLEGKDGWVFNILDRPPRLLESVTLPDSQKIPLIKDIESYLSKETEIFYASRGIPLRRGYLLYGPPGTGKTSFSAAIAGHFRLDLFIVNLNTAGLDDKGLRVLFENFPDRCVVLLEDIDSAGIKRENMRIASGSQDEQNGPRATVTLSGLLNVLDGPASAEGRLVIMTTNAPESLDPALVRPGSIDMRVHLGHACTEVLAKMFKHIFAHTSKEEADNAEATARNKNIDKLANSFASLVPSEMLTPAEVQGFLMAHRSNPEQAVAEAEKWAARLVETKAGGKNVSDPSIVVTPADVTRGAEDFTQGEDDDSRSTDDTLRIPSGFVPSKRSDPKAKKARTKSRK